MSKAKKAKRKDRPVSAKEAERILKDEEEKVFFQQWVLIFSALRDNFGWAGKRMRRIWDENERVCHRMGISGYYDRICTEVKRLTGYDFSGAADKRQYDIVTEYDLMRARGNMRRRAKDFAWCTFLYTLRRTERWGEERLKRVYMAGQDLQDSIDRGYASYEDLIQAMAEEGKIILDLEEGDKEEPETPVTILPRAMTEVRYGQR